jgi:hypothetical protein
VTFFGTQKPITLKISDEAFSGLLDGLATYASTKDKKAAAEKLLNILVNLNHGQMTQKAIRLQERIRGAQQDSVTDVSDLAIAYVKGLFVSMATETTVPEKRHFSNERVRQTYILLGLNLIRTQGNKSLDPAYADMFKDPLTEKDREELITSLIDAGIDPEKIVEILKKKMSGATGNTAQIITGMISYFDLFEQRLPELTDYLQEPAVIGLTHALLAAG